MCKVMPREEGACTEIQKDTFYVPVKFVENDEKPETF
jgi:hypothetical protein